MRLDLHKTKLITYRWDDTFFETINVDFIRVTPSSEEVCHLETLETIAAVWSWFAIVLGFQAKHGLLQIHWADFASSV